MRLSTIKNVLIGAIIIFIMIAIINPKIIFSNTYTCKVTDKAVKRYEDKDTYLIYTVDDAGAAHVFENKDSAIPPKFNSSDLYAIIEIGETYTFHVRGIRLNIFSMYENIYSVEKAE